MEKSSSESSRTPIIICEDVTVSFGDFQALKGISAEIYEKEVIVILGPSGSGKSTVANALRLLRVNSSAEGRSAEPTTTADALATG